MNNTKSTILIQGRAEYLNFALKTFPKIFREVIEMIPKIQQYMTTDQKELQSFDHNPKKRKVEVRPEMGFNCEDCHEVVQDRRNLKIHKMTKHTKTTTNRKKAKYITVEVAKDVKQIKRTLNQLNRSIPVESRNES